jgi:hypothetical protein
VGIDQLDVVTGHHAKGIVLAPSAASIIDPQEINNAGAPQNPGALRTTERTNQK